MASRVWKMCAPAVMDVTLSDIITMSIRTHTHTRTRTRTRITVIISMLILRGRYLLLGRSDREQGVRTRTTWAACSRGAEVTMGSCASDHDGLQRLYLTLLGIGSRATNALFFVLTLPVFAFLALHTAFPQHTPLIMVFVISCYKFLIFCVSLSFFRFVYGFSSNYSGTF